MNSKDMSQFVVRWRELQTRRKELDFDIASLAHDIRAAFAPGGSGDREFITWCRMDLGMTSSTAKVMLDRSVLVARFTSRDLWSQLGGYPSLRVLKEHPAEEQDRILETAKLSGKTVRAVIQDISTPITANPSRCADARADAVELAHFISYTAKEMPPAIAEIVGRYTARTRRRAA